MAKFDAKEIELTPRFIAAVQELLSAEIEMMRCQDDEDCWTWGICYIDDLAELSALSFEFGGDEDKPDILVNIGADVMAIEI